MRQSHSTAGKHEILDSLDEQAQLSYDYGCMLPFELCGIEDAAKACGMTIDEALTYARQAVLNGW